MAFAQSPDGVNLIRCRDSLGSSTIRVVLRRLIVRCRRIYYKYEPRRAGGDFAQNVPADNDTGSNKSKRRRACQKNERRRARLHSEGGGTSQRAIKGTRLKGESSWGFRTPNIYSCSPPRQKKLRLVPDGMTIVPPRPATTPAYSLAERRVARNVH